MPQPRLILQTLAAAALSLTGTLGILAVKLIEWACYAGAIAILAFLGFIEVHTNLYEAIHDTAQPAHLPEEVAKGRNALLPVTAGLFMIGFCLRLMFTPSPLSTFIDNIKLPRLDRMLRRRRETQADH